MPETALVILNYNDAGTTEKLIRLVKDYKVLNHIVVVDNCSPDDSFARLSAYASEKVDVIRTEANRGYACGNNFGAFYAIRQYHPDYLLIANPDVAFTEETVVRLTGALASSDSAAEAAPLVNQGYNVWKLPGYWGIIEALFLLWFNLDKRRQKKKLISKKGIQPVGVVEGSFFCIKSDIFEQIGGFDERTFLYGEENILAKKLCEAGKQVIILADERYDHLHSQSIKKQYHSKAKAFHHFYASFDLYNREYLHTNAPANLFFRFCYGLAYLERVIYDLMMKVKNH